MNKFILTHDDNGDSIMYDVKRLASKLSIGRDAAYSLMKTKGFPAIKFGKKYRVEKSALDEWLVKSRGREIFI